LSVFVDTSAFPAMMDQARFKAVRAVRVGEVAACAVRSTARAGLETGVPSRRVTSALGLHAEAGATFSGWGCAVRGAEHCACRPEGRRSPLLPEHLFQSARDSVGDLGEVGGR